MTVANPAIINRFFNSSHAAELFSTAEWGLTLIYALATLGAFIGLVISIVKLATSNGVPMMRQMALRGILICGVCLALLGSIGLVFIFVVGFGG